MVKASLVLGIAVLVIAAIVIAGCGGDSAATGTLQFNANGEDFVRQGFVSKDGWSISFDHVYITLADVAGYQTEPPYDPHSGGFIDGEVEVGLDGVYTVDLAEGGEDALPILVDEVADAEAGHYNAISWEMVCASSGPAAGYSLVVIGTAEKDGQSIDFTLNIEDEYGYSCGEYVGDEREGILQEDGVAHLEMTFHFDHIFGDAETPLDDELNVDAIGFAPFAGIAENGNVEEDLAGLEGKLAAADYQALMDILPTLGHVGEGHCHCD